MTLVEVLFIFILGTLFWFYSLAGTLSFRGQLALISATS